MRGLKLERPLVFFDLETTGVDVEKDRIVQIAVTKMVPTAFDDTVRKTEDMWLVDPGIHIPEEASAVHQIYDETVEGMPTFSDISKEIAKWFEGADVCGHNVIKFDIPLLEN